MFAWCNDNLGRARVKILECRAGSRSCVSRSMHLLITVMFYGRIILTPYCLKTMHFSSMSQRSSAEKGGQISEPCAKLQRMTWEGRSWQYPLGCHRHSRCTQWCGTDVSQWLPSSGLSALAYRHSEPAKGDPRRRQAVHGTF